MSPSVRDSKKSKKIRKRRSFLPPIKGRSRRLDFPKFNPDCWRRAFKKKEPLTVTEWNEKNIILSSRTTARPGPFRVSHTPYVREVIDAFGDPEVERITGMTAAQWAKTQAINAMVAYAIDQDPGSALFVFPSVDMSKSFSETRFDVMVHDNKSLRQHKYKEPKKYKLLEKHFKTMSLHFTGASSPANLASRPIRYLFMDEIDKYPLATDREAAAVDLAEQRVATYWNRKIVCFSTPTLKTGAINLLFKKGDQRYFWVPCLSCGEGQVLEMAQLLIGDESRDENGEPVRDLVIKNARYHCKFCDYAHAERDKPQMLQQGIWKPSSFSARHRSFHGSRLYSPFTPWGECLSDFLAARNDVMALKNVVQNILGEPWEEPGLTIDEAAVLDHRTEYTEGEIPGDIFCAFLTADVSDDRTYFIVRAFGRHATSWLVRWGIVERPEDLASVASQGIRGKNGIYTIEPRNVWVDTGFRPSELYPICKRHGWTPIKGADPNIRAWEFPVQKSKTISNLHLIDTHRFKEDLVRAIENPPGGPGSWNLPKVTNLPYARHICAEKAVRVRDKWGRDKIEWRRQGPNHWRDCEVYALAAAFWRNIKDWSGPQGKGPSKTITWGMDGSRGPGM